jgi:hypothetical protein
VEENLLASRPDEILSAINALDIAILKFHLGVAPLCI